MSVEHPTLTTQTVSFHSPTVETVANCGLARKTARGSGARFQKAPHHHGVLLSARDCGGRNRPCRMDQVTLLPNCGNEADFLPPTGAL